MNVEPRPRESRCKRGEEFRPFLGEGDERSRYGVHGFFAFRKPWEKAGS